jgi:hypothetical protein
MSRSCDPAHTCGYTLSPSLQEAEAAPWPPKSVQRGRGEEAWPTRPALPWPSGAPASAWPPGPMGADRGLGRALVSAFQDPQRDGRDGLSHTPQTPSRPAASAERGRRRGGPRGSLDTGETPQA